jgi:histidinol-phosphatase (PHP family)
LFAEFCGAELATSTFISKVSAHGGHSGPFCGHARGSLESIVDEYVRQGFEWVGITEHMPPPQERFMYPEEAAAGESVQSLRDRFDRYMSTCRRIQKERSDRIRIYVGFESEAFSGALETARQLRRAYRPDYIVGSVHHVDDIGFDLSPETYRIAGQQAGGLDELYRRYFDRQYEMIRQLRPEVVGHFDLIRIFDADYRNRLQRRSIQDRVQRNLKAIRQLGLAVDVNFRAFLKGFDEPYPAIPILRQAIEWGIALLPGDDAHEPASVGAYMDEGLQLLESLGADCRWRTPVAPASHSHPL